ncbi:MAG TPA: hydroxymethylbilane synthase [Gemmatimonadales bacterium]|nr:hydroxymethylbilane synthase [Gemmatimonadales bacterium]
MRIGTRGSKLALWQAEWVKAELARHGTAAEIVVIKTRGDAEVDRPFQQMEGKGFFTKEIEDALLATSIDVAVHSLKDLPTQLPDGLVLGPVPERADTRDALIARAGATLALLPAGAKLGTSSLRRVAQVRHLRPDLDLVPLRGNVPTRVDKVLAKGELDAALLACAGLTRLGLDGKIAARLDPLEVMPAPGQGALGLELRADDARTAAALAPLAHPPSAMGVTAERTLLATLGGGCQAPVAAYTAGTGEGGTGKGRLYGRVTAPDGTIQLTASAEIDPADPAAAGRTVARLLQEQGAGKFLAR